MKDLSIDIVKDNTYFVKSPSDGQIIRYFVDVGDKIEKNQLIAILKINNAYIEIKSDFSGSVLEVCLDIDEDIDKWEDIVLVDVKSDSDDFGDIAASVNSPDYRIIYAFQQDILPKLIYNETEMFLDGIAHDYGNFIHFLLNEVYTNNHMVIPFSSDNFRLTEELFMEKILVITIHWPKLKGPLLTRRSYLLINTESRKIQYFTCEKSLDDELIISSIIPINGRLTRYNYGFAPENVDDEKNKVINIFIQMN